MTIHRIAKVGHRGAAGHAPENTISGLERGIELDADFIEIDVQRTSDGHLVLMHDKSVDPTTNGTGTLCEMSLEELRHLDAGNGQQVPLLEEALTVMGARAGITIECITPGIGAQVYREVREF